MKRFDLDADTVDDAGRYFRNRAFQLLREHFRWSAEVTPLTHEGETWGVETTYTKPDGTCYSAYVLASHRGKGHMTRYLASMEGSVFVTVGPCNVDEFLEKHVSVELVGDHLDWPEYKKIEAFYGDRKAKRSKLFLMNHVDEGIALLHWLHVDPNVQAAFALHPLVQRDEDLAANLKGLSPDPQHDQYEPGWIKNEGDIPDPTALVLAMEYRNIANQFLSPMEDHPGYWQGYQAIALSPLAAVNQMLIADKIQNYKDFLLYHKATHPDAELLDRYFRQWLRRLDVSEEQFAYLSKKIRVSETWAVTEAREA